ncbi:YkvA family protein [Paenibacillus sp. NPDC058071]|uniref:YkvA family protein n=1 Tax=Paenibacillus sp. NPDC058071 TaxID=3346326 RepID=UPI0036DE290E
MQGTGTAEYQAFANASANAVKNEAAVKKGFWSKMKRAAGKIPFAKEAVSMYYCAIDAKTPVYAKGIAFAALAYFISPIDVIPDAIVVLGFTDDASVVAAALAAIGRHVTEDHKGKAEVFFSGEAAAPAAELQETGR